MSPKTACQVISKHEQSVCYKSTIPRKDVEPYFAVYDPLFKALLGTDPSIALIAEKDWAFAHEAGVFIPDQDALYVTINRLDEGIQISKVSKSADNTWNVCQLSTEIKMGNGGINHEGGVLFCDQGDRSVPSALVHMAINAPYACRTLLDNYYGRHFNSLNDVAIHTDGSIWFTDPIYGYDQGFKDKPQLPCHVYRFDPSSGDVRVVADGFGRPNGLCFSPDEETLYVTDTDWIHGDGTTDDGRPSTIYAFDVIARYGSHFLANRRVFAAAAVPIPDGIKCDMEGHVYSGCGDGVNIWTPGGVLIGKIVCSGGVANFCFMRKGELALLNESRLYLVNIDRSVQGALLKNMGIGV